MEKISGILPTSKRMFSINLQATVRPGVPSFSRPVARQKNDFYEYEPYENIDLNKAEPPEFLAPGSYLDVKA